MRFLGFVLANLGRNRLRSILTILGIAVAVFLLCSLEAAVSGLRAGIELSSASRLVVRNAINVSVPLPIAYGARLRDIPGVEDLSWSTWFGGRYTERNARVFFAQFAVDPESYLRLYPEYLIDPAEREAFLGDRRGCLLGATLAEQIGKKVGDRLVLEGAIFPGTWEFAVRGIYRGAESSADDRSMLFHFAYLDEGVEPVRKSTASVFWLKLRPGADPATVARAVDARFESSAASTRTETEAAFRLGFVTRLGNVPLLLRFVGLAVAFTMLLVAANTMVMAAFERTTEFGVLKTLGFRDRTIFSLTLAESMTLALAGGLLGAGISFALLGSKGFPLVALFQIQRVPLGSIAAGLGAALLTGLLGGLAPAFAAARLRVVEAIRRI